MRKYLGGHAAKHDRRNPASPVRGHDDEIAASLLGDVNDSLVRMILFDLHGFAGDTSCASLFGDRIHRAVTVLPSADGRSAPILRAR